VLFTVLITLTVMASIILLVSYSSAIDADAPARHLEADRTTYLAQAAMQHAVWMNQNGACTGDMTLPAGTLGGDSYSASISGAGTTTSLTASVDQDAWIRSDDVTRNSGTSPDHHIRFEGGKVEQALIRFDLSGVTPNAFVNSATAWFFVEAGKPHPEGSVTIHRVTDAWTEAGATWETMSDRYASSVLATIPPQASGGVWVPVNLTGQVQAWVNGQPNFGLLLASVAEGVHGEYHSRENGSNPPRLDIVVGNAPASPVAISAVGTLANGNSRTLTEPAARAYQPVSTLVLQPGAAAGVDAYIWESNSNRNYGDSGETWVATGNNNEALALFRFDLDAIPANSRIINATLSVHHRNGNDPNVPVTAHRISRDWEEDEASWNRRTSGDNWTSPGGDYDSAVVSTTDVGPGTNSRYEWDLSSLVQDWSNGVSPNYGVLLRTDAPGIFGERFDTSDHSDATRHPRLTVRYACECGKPCIAPQGAAGNVLMVIGGSPANPSTFDKAIRDKLQGWGYSITLIQDDDSTGNFNSAFAVHDAVFVSETANAGNIGAKLTSAPIGVVSAQGTMNNELGIATSFASPVSANINVVDTNHFITAVFPPGPLDVYSSAMEGLSAAGTISSGAQRLAEWSGGVGLVALDAGATQVAGGTAAGRRVMLPFGRRSNLELDYVGNAGWLLVYRSLTWAIDGDSGGAGTLLLVVGNGPNPSVRDQDRQALIESWGYSVVVIDDDADQASMDAAVAGSDIVYVSASAGDNALGAKLADAPRGVISEDGDQLNDLGFASDVPNTVTYSQFTATVPTHYISEPFAGSAVTQFTSNQSMPMPTGTIAPDLAGAAALGRLEYAIATLDAGRRRWDGDLSPARRVHLPFGAAQVDQISDDGKTLMRRALEWAAGVGCGGLRPLALVVANAANPDRQESARQSLAETWCYEVHLVSAAEPQEVYQKYASAVDAFYVSATVNYSDVTSKLKLQPVGVVNEVSTLSPYLGFTSGTGGFSGNSTTITGEIHEITEPFAAGDLAITTSSQPLHRLVNTIGPGLHSLSTRGDGGDRMLMTLSRGDELLWGGHAAGRRVMLPWGGNTFDINALNDDGRTLLRRSVDWAGRSDPLAPIAHWKLDEGSGSIAADSAGGHDGTLSNSPAWSTGPVDGALNFDGTNDNVIVPHDDSLSLQAAMTFSAWINASSFGASYQTILAKDSGFGDSNYWFGTWQDELDFGFFANGFYREVFTTDLNLQPGAGYHVAASFDGGSGQVKLYVDGAQVRTGTIGFSPTPVSANLRIGRSPDGEYWRGILDDIRIYDDIVPADRIAALHAAGDPGNGGGGGGVTDPAQTFVETFRTWSAVAANSWQTQDLGSLGVPPNAVVEVAILNASNNRERWGGVRATGSNLNRGFLLHEAESGGTDIVSMHVQADGNSRIQHFAENSGNISFVLLGYWTGASYTERFDSFSADEDGEWESISLAGYGVGPNQVAELVMANSSDSNDIRAGARTPGSNLDRRITIQEAESGGIDAIGMMVRTNASARAEIAADSDSIAFYVVGYWDTPPGNYVEAYRVGQAVRSARWHQADATNWGAPANSVAHFLLTNDTDAAEKTMGIRQTGSALGRVLDIQEAEAGGSDAVSLHVNLDTSRRLEIYSESAGADRYFHVLGWWVLP
jgi:hypothetical protein